MAKLTIKQIAEKAGVSTASVSYVLNHKQGVGRETTERIMKVIREEGYMANLNSRRLATGRSYNVHAVIRSAAAPACKAFYQEVMLELMNDVSSCGYNLLTAYHLENGVDEALISSIESGNTDGMIFFQGADETVRSALKRHGIPAVIVNPGFDSGDIPCVNIDFEELSLRVTRYLCENGHRNIAYFGMNSLPGFYRNTFSGYSEALKACGITVRDELVIADIADEFDALEKCRALLKSGVPVTAAFCVQDVFAVSCIKAALQEGLDVPGDFSVAGIDDLRMSGLVHPGLTTLRIPVRELASVASGMLFDMIAGHPVSSVTLLPGDMVIRDSVRSIV